MVLSRRKPLTVHMIFPDGTYEAKKLGLNVEAGPSNRSTKACDFRLVGGGI